MVQRAGQDRPGEDSLREIASQMRTIGIRAVEPVTGPGKQELMPYRTDLPHTAAFQLGYRRNPDEFSHFVVTSMALPELYDTWIWRFLYKKEELPAGDNPVFIFYCGKPEERPSKGGD